MKRERISEALSNISDEYKAEALELHNRKVVSGTVNMKKKIFTIALAAAITTALGVTAYAALSGINVRNGEPEESYTVNYPAESVEATAADGSDIIVNQPEQELMYHNVSKIITFDGRTSCAEVEMNASYLPEDYAYNWGGANTWCDIIQGDYNHAEKCFNVRIFYESQFGADGCMFTQDIITSEVVEEDGDFIIYKWSGTVYGCGDLPINYYIMYNTVEGYIIVIDTTDDMQLCEDIAAGLEIRPTGRTVDYDSFDVHDTFLCTGVG